MLEMSYKVSLVKVAIKWTPKLLVLLIANIVLRGIAKLTDFSFDLDARKAYFQTRLYGEAEIIEVLVEGFSIITDGESHKLFVQQAQSNRPWLNNLLSRVVGKPWKIPDIPQLAPHMEFIAELFKAEGPAR